MRAIDVMTAHVATVSPDTPVEEIARRLIERGVSAVPVVEAEGKVVGMVSEGDLIRRPELGTERQPSWWIRLLTDPEQQAAQYIKSHGKVAKDIMSTPVWTVEEHATLAEIAAMLEERKIKRVPVVRNGSLIGIVSRANLLHGLAAGLTGAPIAATDPELRSAVLEGLTRQAGVRDEFINVTVADGVVHLWGSVPTQTELDAARVVAENAPGTKRVENHLHVVPLQIRGV